LQNNTGIAVSAGHVCITNSANRTSKTYCFGGDMMGQLGNGGNLCFRPDPRVCPDKRLASPVLGNLALSQLASGSGFTCGTTALDDLYCWGSSRKNALGSLGSATAPTAFEGLPSYFNSDILAVGDDHVCVYEDGVNDGELYCWGDNEEGQTGLNNDNSTISSPGEVGGLGRIIRLSAGYSHTCLINPDRTVICFGANNHGQHGLGEPGNSSASNRSPVLGLGFIAQ
jgi:alpha-tubulin suppressor-like RCC1 family protein